MSRSPTLEAPAPATHPPPGRSTPRRRGVRRDRRRQRRSAAGDWAILLVVLVVAAAVRWSCVPVTTQSTPAPTATASGASAAGPILVTPRSPIAAPATYADSGLQALVERLVDEPGGSTAVAVRHLRSGASAAHHEDDILPAASLAKLPILIEVFRVLEAGTLREDESVTVTPDALTDGAGVLQASVGEQFSVSELLRLAVTISDNVAARLLLRRVGGVDAVNRTMAAMGLSHTRLYADDRPNTTSAGDMAELLAWLDRWPLGQDATGPASMRRAARLPPRGLAALLALPQGQAWLSAGVPEEVVVAHKSGQLPSLRHDAGIVYGTRGPYVVVGLTNCVADQDDAEAFLTHLSRSVYEYFER